MRFTMLLMVNRFDSDSPHPQAAKRGDITDIIEVGVDAGTQAILGYQPVEMEFPSRNSFDRFRAECGSQVENTADRKTVDLDDLTLFDAATITASRDRAKAMRHPSSPLRSTFSNGRPAIKSRHQVVTSRVTPLAPAQSATRSALAVVLAARPVVGGAL